MYFNLHPGLFPSLYAVLVENTITTSEYRITESSQPECFNSVMISRLLYFISNQKMRRTTLLCSFMHKYAIQLHYQISNFHFC